VRSSSTIEVVDTTNWNELRSRMIEEQLKSRHIRDEHVLEAMRLVPRHLFVPEDIRNRSYEDKALPTYSKQTISQPYMIALMLQELGLQGREKVLEIGTGTGYQAALLGRLANDVHTLEIVPELAAIARQNIAATGLTNVHVHETDGSLGLPSQAPFDAIIVAAAAPDVPQVLVDQLASEGTLLIPIGPREHQKLTRIQKQGSQIMRQTSTSCTFVPLRGAHGWPQA
jgi:protein-L-isoaspartate(D-aspartate) O-methyltransferase